ARCSRDWSSDVCSSDRQRGGHRGPHLSGTEDQDLHDGRTFPVGTASSPGATRTAASLPVRRAGGGQAGGRAAGGRHGAGKGRRLDRKSVVAGKAPDAGG